MFNALSMISKLFVLSFQDYDQSDYTCPFGEHDSYNVIFYNNDKEYPVDIIGKNKDGTEKTITSLAPGELYSVLTYFTREWIFKRYKIKQHFPKK